MYFVEKIKLYKHIKLITVMSVNSMTTKISFLRSLTKTIDLL